MNATNGTQIEDGSFVANGRMWYTSLGHTIEIWQDATFLAHIKGGIDWVLESEASGTEPDNNATGIPAAGVVASQPASASPTSSGWRSPNLSAFLLVSLVAGAMLAANMQ